MSTSATPSGRPDSLARSISSARCATSAPWFSAPVSGSRRVASTSAAVCRVSRPCADRNTRNRSAAATSPADSVTMTTSRRTSARRSRIGAASRHTATTARTWPSDLIGRYSRTTRSASTAPGPALCVRGRHDRRLGPAAGRETELGVLRHLRTRGAGLARRQDAPVQQPDLDAQDLPRSRQRGRAAPRGSPAAQQSCRSASAAR